MVLDIDLHTAFLKKLEQTVHWSKLNQPDSEKNSIIVRKKYKLMERFEKFEVKAVKI